MDDSAAAETQPGWLRLSLLWLLGMDLRLTILAVPPVLPLIHRDLHLNEKTVAALTGLPVLLFAVAAVPGSLLIARVGARRAVIAGVLVVALGSALRGVGSSAPMLFAMTAVMGAGVAVMQPALPALVGSWFAGRVPLATAAYANGLLVGEILPASLTIPILLPLMGGSWQASFALWSIPVLATAFLLLCFTPHATQNPGGARARFFMLGGGSALYFGCNAFLPDYLHAIGRADLLNAGLTALNVGQLPASFLIMLCGRRLVGRKAPFIAGALAGLVSLVGLLVPSAPVMIAAAGLIGFAAAFTLILALALPPLLARPDEVHRLAAGMLTLAYTITFILPYFGGAVWDATHISEAALLPGVVGALIVVAMASTFRLERNA